MLVKITEDLVKLFIKKIDELEVKELNSNDENEVFIKVMVNSEDYDNVISVISSIKTLVQAKSYLENDKKIKIEVDKF